MQDAKKPNAQALGFFERCLPLRASDVAYGSDVHCVSDVSPYGEVGKFHFTLRPLGAIFHLQSYRFYATLNSERRLRYEEAQRHDEKEI